MEIKEISLSDLVPDPKNTRIHDEDNIAMIIRSLNKFGQYRAMVVQQDGMIVRVGNGMFQAMKEMGWETASCEVRDMDDDEATVLSILDNKASDLSVFDDKKLSDTLNSLSDTAFDLTGFSKEQVNSAIFSSNNKISKFDKLTDFPCYNFVFSNKEDLEKWVNFLEYLKTRYPEPDKKHKEDKKQPVGAKFIQFLKDEKHISEDIPDGSEEG